MTALRNIIKTQILCSDATSHFKNWVVLLIRAEAYLGKLFYVLKIVN